VALTATCTLDSSVTVSTAQADVRVLGLDIQRVPEWLYAEAPSAVPIAFVVEGYASEKAWLTEGTVTFLYRHTDGGGNWLSAFTHNFGQAFAAHKAGHPTPGYDKGFGPRDNGSQKIYWAWVPNTPSTFKGVDVDKDTTRYAKFHMTVTVQHGGEGNPNPAGQPENLTLKSLKWGDVESPWFVHTQNVEQEYDDPQGKVAQIFGDKNVQVVELKEGEVGKVFSEPIGVFDQDTRQTNWHCRANGNAEQKEITHTGWNHLAENKGCEDEIAAEHPIGQCYKWSGPGLANKIPQWPRYEKKEINGSMCVHGFSAGDESHVYGRTLLTPGQRKLRVYMMDDTGMAECGGECIMSRVYGETLAVHFGFSYGWREVPVLAGAPGRDLGQESGKYRVTLFPNASVKYCLWDLHDGGLNVTAAFAGALAGLSAAVTLGTSLPAWAVAANSMALGSSLFSVFDAVDAPQQTGKGEVVWAASRQSIHRNGTKADPNVYKQVSRINETHAEEAEEGDAPSENASMDWDQDLIMQVGETVVHSCALSAALEFYTPVWFTDEGGVWILFTWPDSDYNYIVESH